MQIVSRVGVIALTLGIWVGTRVLAFALLHKKIPDLASSYYAPFVSAFLDNPSFDPWHQWKEIGGEVQAFPYGWMMLIIISSLGFLLGAAGIHIEIAFFLTLILFDLLSFLMLILILKEEGKQTQRFVSIAYASSPVGFLILGMVGPTDFIPMALVMGGYYALRMNRFGWAGALIGAAVGSKIILLVMVAGPFLYFRRATIELPGALRFSLAFAFVSITSLSPALYSSTFIESFFASGEVKGALTFGVQYSEGTILLLPLAVIVTWFLLYQQRRMNLNLLALAIALPLIVVAALPGAPVGWLLWSLPLALYLSSRLNNRIKALTLVAFNLPVLPLLIKLFAADRLENLDNLILDIISTASMALLALMSIAFWREHAKRSDFARLHSRPALVLIAGDSGTGKDTLAAGLERALGSRTTFRLSGDDYHRWNRGHSSWGKFTHLNPSANELHRFFNDVMSLGDGSHIRVRKYDHETGKITSSQRQKDKEFVIASGLHALFIPDLNRHAELTLYMEMSEEMRFYLKLQRDTDVRGHSPVAVSKSIKEREKDSNSFIHPQRDNADLIVSASSDGISETGRLEQVKIELESDFKSFDRELVSELTLTCGLETRVEVLGPNRRKLVVHGTSTPNELTDAFSRLEPRICGILGNPKEWSEGPAGVVQLITMIYLSNSLRRNRLVK